MEELLKQIMVKLEKLDKLETQFTNLGSTVNTGFSDTSEKIESLGNRIEMHDRSNKEEFKQVFKKLDGITEAVAQTMEDITELKATVEK